LRISFGILSVKISTDAWPACSWQKGEYYARHTSLNNLVIAGYRANASGNQGVGQPWHKGLYPIQMQQAIHQPPGNRQAGKKDKPCQHHPAKQAGKAGNLLNKTAHKQD